MVQRLRFSSIAFVASIRTGGLCQFIITAMKYASPIVKTLLKECVLRITLRVNYDKQYSGSDG